MRINLIEHNRWQEAAEQTAADVVEFSGFSPLKKWDNLECVYLYMSVNIHIHNLRLLWYAALIPSIAENKPQNPNWQLTSSFHTHSLGGGQPPMQATSISDNKNLEKQIKLLLDLVPFMWLL